MISESELRVIAIMCRQIVIKQELKNEIALLRQQGALPREPLYDTEAAIEETIQDCWQTIQKLNQ